MADRIDDLTGRVQTVETKLDVLSSTVTGLSVRVDVLSGTVEALSGRVDALSGRVDDLSRSVARSDAVDAAFVEQRAYVEFVYTRLDTKMDAGFGRLERKLDQFIDAQVRTNELVDRRLRALEMPDRAM